MDNSFFEALSSLGSEANVDTALLVEKVKSAMLKAARKAYPECEENISVEIDPATKTFEMYLRQTVVDDEPIDANEVNIDVARTIDPNACVGGFIERRLDIAKFGRAAAQSAKQSIKGDLREINRERILGEFESLENDCITCEVSQVETGGTATLLYHKTELYLFRNEQIPGEVLKEGQRVKVYITTIANKQKKPIIKISRVRKELVKRLFELEIPEIYDGTVEIKSISREAGSRTKVAVWSNDPNVDAIGACGADAHYTSEMAWMLEGDTLTITAMSNGSGVMENYSDVTAAPWNAYADRITKIVLVSGVKNIGENAFAGLTEVNDVTVPASVEIAANAENPFASAINTITFGYSKGSDFEAWLKAPCPS